MRAGKLGRDGRQVVLDTDLIDLTMIPPPMTPDEVRAPRAGREGGKKTVR